MPLGQFFRVATFSRHPAAISAAAFCAEAEGILERVRLCGEKHTAYRSKEREEANTTVYSFNFCDGVAERGNGEKFVSMTFLRVEGRFLICSPALLSMILAIAFFFY